MNLPWYWHEWLFGAAILLTCLSPLAYADNGDDLLNIILQKMEAAVDCASCLDLLEPLQTLAHMGDDTFSSTFITVCKTLKLEDDDVCEGTYTLTGPVLAHSLRRFTIGGNTSIKFCHAAFQLCNQPFTPFQVHFPKPAPPQPHSFTSKGRKPIQVVHFSDVHVDRQYTLGADGNCTKNICCRNFADHTGPIVDPAQPFGNSHCDTPAELAQSMLEAIEDIGPRFSIFTGDVIEGTTWLIDKSAGQVDLSAWNAQMASKTRAPIYGAIGNHDTSPVNGFARNDTITPRNSDWVFETQSQGWQQWIHAAAADQLRHTSGSYSVVVPGTNLRLISVNTQFWYPQDFWLYDTDNMPTDPSGTLGFMVSQLQKAEDDGQRAWIFGHIPPGKADIFLDQSNAYDQIIQRYKNTVTGQFYGHSHKDQFEIAYSDWDNQSAETADSVALIAPALTPTSGNPAFKVYDVDPDTYQILDSKVYLTNISDPNFHIKPTWHLYYSARESYGAMVGEHLRPNDPLDASFWHKLTEVFEKNETAFQIWNSRLSREGAIVPCTGECITTSICDMRAARSQNNCDVGSGAPAETSKNANRELLEAPHHEDACEGNKARAIFTKLLSGKSEYFSESSKAAILKSVGPIMMDSVEHSGGSQAREL